MIIIETSIFTRQVQALLDDDDYRRLQTILVIRPDAGDLISGVVVYAKFVGALKGEASAAVCV